jgi:hypothetical protein
LAITVAPLLAASIDAVMGDVDGHNDDPSPFIWSKTAEEILEKVGRARRALDNAPTA